MRIHDLIPAKRRLLALAHCAVALPASAASGSPAGDLDPSIDGDGSLVVSQPRQANEVLVQADGKILVIGECGPAEGFRRNAAPPKRLARPQP